MKNISRVGPNRSEPSGRLRPEYRLDYSKAKPNRFASQGSAKAVVVLLDPDVAKVFRSAESVNSALRAILSAVPRKRSSR
jgi:hypothetical protein